MRKSFNRKPKVKEELTYDSFLQSFNKDDFYEENGLLGKVLKALTPIQRAETIISFMEKTPYTSYSLIMKNLRRLYNRYVELKEKRDLEVYLDNLTNTGEGGLYRSLLLIREGLIRDLLHDSVHECEHAVSEMILGLVHEVEPNDLSNVDFEEMFDKRMREYMIHVAGYIWPEAKGLTVLFGAKNEA